MLIFEIIKKWKGTLNVKLKLPVGGSNSLLVSHCDWTESFESESALLPGMFTLTHTVDSFRNEPLSMLRDAKQCCDCLDPYLLAK